MYAEAGVLEVKADKSSKAEQEHPTPTLPCRGRGGRKAARKRSRRTL